MKNNIECCTPSIVDLIREKGRNCNGVNILFEIVLRNNENSNNQNTYYDAFNRGPELYDDSWGDPYGDSWGDSW